MDEVRKVIKQCHEEVWTILQEHRWDPAAAAAAADFNEIAMQGCVESSRQDLCELYLLCSADAHSASMSSGPGLLLVFKLAMPILASDLCIVLHSVLDLLKRAVLQQAFITASAWSRPPSLHQLHGLKCQSCTPPAQSRVL
jgi:hypothetical protein